MTWKRRATGSLPADRSHSEAYLAYLKSPEWAVRRVQALARVGHKCERCGAEGVLHVHHLTYDRLGKERDEDLKVVCPPCHDVEDKIRARRSERVAYNRRLDAWATKVYGEDWASFGDVTSIAEEFDEWVWRKERYG